MTIKTLRVGLAVGHGTGRELTAVFERVIQALASRYSLSIEFTRSPQVYHSYHTLTVSGSDKDLIQHIADETTKDAEHYRGFCEDAAAERVTAIFRTAMHAQSLYMVRDQLQAVKIEHFDLGDSNALLFIRDEAQGFYAGVNQYHDGEDSLTRTSPFSRAIFDQILQYALDRARDEWGVENTPNAVTLVYKFHLFDGVFQAWAPHWKSQFGVDVDFVQPDTMNRSLMASGVQGRRIIIAGNEYADIIQPVFLKWFGNLTPETMYAENVYLHPRLHRLREYQTVHGSADAIAGQGLVNPFATIRAAAAVLEHHGGSSSAGVQALTEKAIEALLLQNQTTPDQGGALSTNAVTDSFLEAIGRPEHEASLKSLAGSLPPAEADFSRPWMGKKSALLVVDYQNDFISSKPSPMMAELSTNIPRLVDLFRTHEQEVIFVRFLGNSAYQGPSWQHRNTRLKKPERCVKGTWGAELGPGVVPRPQERTFEKAALLDPFLVPEFSDYLAGQGFEHVILAGLYTDVCVDATARTAFQRGLWVTVVADCTTTLHSKQDDQLDYMRKVYGARTVDVEDLVKMAVGVLSQK